MADNQTQLDIIIAAQDKASSSLREISSQLGAMRESVSGLSAASAEGQVSTQSLTGAFIGSQLALSAMYEAAHLASEGLREVFALAEDALRSAADYEQIRVAFDGLLGSADKARVLLKEVSNYAVKTPFALPTVAEGAKKLLAFGVAADQIIPTFRMLGDISLGNTQKLGSLIHAFGQVQATGHLMARELYEFRMQGVNLGGELAKQFGVSEVALQKMVTKGQVGLPAVEQALKSMTSQGGLFFQGMERQSHTFNGTIINLQDDFGRLGREIVGISDSGDIRQGSLFAKLKDAAQGLLSYIDKNRAAIQAFATKELDQLIKFVQTEAVPALQKFGEQLGKYLSSPQFPKDLHKVTTELLQIVGALKTMADIGDQAAATLNSIQSFESNAAKNTRGLISGPLGALGNAWQHLGDGHRYASGTLGASGGWSVVGERGPELVNLSPGSQVMNAGQTRGALGQGANYTFNHYGDIRSDVDLRGAMREFGFMVTR